MKFSVNALLAACVAVLVPAHLYGLSLLVSIEHRLTALETAEIMRSNPPRNMLDSPHGNPADLAETLTMKGKAKMGEAKMALKAFDTEHKGKTLTDAQKEKRAELAKAARSEQFRKAANKQAATALKAIERVGKLGKLPHTKEQTEKLRKAFADGLTAAFAKLTSAGEKGEEKALEIV